MTRAQRLSTVARHMIGMRRYEWRVSNCVRLLADDINLDMPLGNVGGFIGPTDRREHRASAAKERAR